MRPRQCDRLHGGPLQKAAEIPRKERQCVFSSFCRTASSCCPPSPAGSGAGFPTVLVAPNATVVLVCPRPSAFAVSLRQGQGAARRLSKQKQAIQLLRLAWLCCGEGNKKEHSAEQSITPSRLCYVASFFYSLLPPPTSHGRTHEPDASPRCTRCNLALLARCGGGYSEAAMATYRYDPPARAPGAVLLVVIRPEREATRAAFDEFSHHPGCAFYSARNITILMFCFSSASHFCLCQHCTALPSWATAFWLLPFPLPVALS